MSPTRAPLTKTCNLPPLVHGTLAAATARVRSGCSWRASPKGVSENDTQRIEWRAAMPRPHGSSSCEPGAQGESRGSRNPQNEVRLLTAHEKKKMFQSSRVTNNEQQQSHTLQLRLEACVHCGFTDTVAARSAPTIGSTLAFFCLPALQRCYPGKPPPTTSQRSSTHTAQHAHRRHHIALWHTAPSGDAPLASAQRQPTMSLVGPRPAGSLHRDCARKVSKCWTSCGLHRANVQVTLRRRRVGGRRSGAFDAAVLWCHDLRRRDLAARIAGHTWNGARGERAGR